MNCSGAETQSDISLRYDCLLKYLNIIIQLNIMRNVFLKVLYIANYKHESPFSIGSLNLYFPITETDLTEFFFANYDPNKIMSNHFFE